MLQFKESNLSQLWCLYHWYAGNCSICCDTFLYFIHWSFQDELVIKEFDWLPNMYWIIERQDMFCVVGYLVCICVACIVKNELNLNMSLDCPLVES